MLGRYPPWKRPHIVMAWLLVVCSLVILAWVIDYTDGWGRVFCVPFAGAVVFYNLRAARKISQP